MFAFVSPYVFDYFLQNHYSYNSRVFLRIPLLEKNNPHAVRPYVYIWLDWQSLRKVLNSTWPLLVKHLFKVRNSRLIKANEPWTYTTPATRMVSSSKTPNGPWSLGVLHLSLQSPRNASSLAIAPETPSAGEIGEHHDSKKFWEPSPLK